MIKKILKKLYINSDNQNYDEKHLGTFNFWRLLFYNLIFPGRTLNRIKFGQTFKNKKNIVKNFNSYQYQSNKNCSKTELSSALENLCSNGGCVIKNYFPESVINNFIDENKELIKNLKSYESNHIDYKIETLKLSKTLSYLWMEKNLINLIKSFFGTGVYARNYPYIYYTYVPSINKTNQNESQVADSWHIDHSVLFNLHILLEDVSEEDTCMEIVPKSHKNFTIASLYTDNVVNQFSKDRIKCTGKKGTVYMHTGNAVHRLSPKSGSNRLNLHFEFTPGSNILVDVNNIKKCLDSEFNIESLEKYQREILKVIFPTKQIKGYDIKNGKIFPTKFLGI